jgi:integrase
LIEKIETISVRAWLDRWLRAEKGAVAETTFEKYQSLVANFLAYLGTRQAIALEALSTEDFLKYRDHLLAEGRAPRTVNITIRKILKRPFEAAVNEGYVARNPIAAIRHLRDVTIEKGVFSPEEIRKLADAAQGTDWNGLVLAGYYTGARLLDLVRLTWGAVDLQEHSITFVQKKTGAKIKVPIHPELEDHLLAGSVPDDGRKPLFPKLYHLRSSGKSGLSSSFRRLMDRAGIDPGIARQKAGKAGRNVSLLSFHSLRHSFTSSLANAGVSAEIRQKLTGHADAKSHAVYTHHEFETIKEALEKLGRLPQASQTPK